MVTWPTSATMTMGRRLPLRRFIRTHNPGVFFARASAVFSAEATSATLVSLDVLASGIKIFEVGHYIPQTELVTEMGGMPTTFLASISGSAGPCTSPRADISLSVEMYKSSTTCFFPERSTAMPLPFLRAGPDRELTCSWPPLPGTGEGPFQRQRTSRLLCGLLYEVLSPSGVCD